MPSAAPVLLSCVAQDCAEGVPEALRSSDGRRQDTAIGLYTNLSLGRVAPIRATPGHVDLCLQILSKAQHMKPIFSRDSEEFLSFCTKQGFLSEGEVQ